MSNALEATFDEINYESEPISLSDPERLGALGRILGLQAPSLEKCRVLELGAGVGMNIIPLAYVRSNSEFVGIDLSGKQIERAQRLIDSTGLKNISMKHLDILNVGPEIGNFDYIICHGTFSWVPQNVRDKIWKIFAERLTENGIAYLSYNALPGWHVRGALREIMLHGSRNAKTAAERAASARATLETLVQLYKHESATPRPAHLKPPAAGEFGPLLLAEAAKALSMPDWYLTHDFIAEYNQPFYVHQVVAKAAENGLQYLGDAEIAEMFPQDTTTETQSFLRRLPNSLELEQWMDFVRNRMFRRSLFCRASFKLDRRLDPERLKKLFVSSSLIAREPYVSVTGHEVQAFSSPNFGGLNTHEPVMKAAVQKLSSIFPQAISFEELASEAMKATGAPASAMQAHTNSLASALLRCYIADLVRFHIAAPRATRSPSDMPRASLLARTLAASRSSVPNLLHEGIPVSSVERLLLALLDGTRTRVELLSHYNEGATALSLSSSSAIPTMEVCLDGLCRKGLIEQ